MPCSKVGLGQSKGGGIDSRVDIGRVDVDYAPVYAGVDVSIHKSSQESNCRTNDVP